MTGLIFKVFVLSTALSIAIKYGAPALLLAPTTMNALLAVWLPAAIAAVILGWRWQQKPGEEEGERLEDRE